MSLKSELLFCLSLELREQYPQWSNVTDKLRGACVLGFDWIASGWDRIVYNNNITAGSSAVRRVRAEQRESRYFQLTNRSPSHSHSRPLCLTVSLLAPEA